MYSQIASNKRRSVIYALGFVVLVGVFGYVLSASLGRPSYFYPILIFAIAYALFSYFGSAKLAIMTSGAKEIAKADAPELYRIVENLSITAGLPMPKVYIIDDPSPNAFATGRDPQHAVVAVTTGILQVLEKNELEGVLAHELSHVGNYDIRFMAVIIALVAVISLLADLFLRLTFWGGIGGDDEEGGMNPVMLALGIAGAILAPIAAAMLQMAISRRREFLADASGALLTRYPEGLATALEKIEADPRGLQQASSATAPLYFSNPLKGRKGFAQSISNMFSTHPPTSERVKRLREMESSQ
jgi:heat shock protein HtpX